MKTSIQNILMAMGLIVSLSGLAGCAGTSSSTSTGQYIDDAAITAKVKTELLKTEKVGGWNVNVETFKGKVQLSGFVSSPEEKKKAEELAKNVAGVKSVENDLIVKANRQAPQ